MKKRAYERIPLDIKIDFLQNGSTHAGTIKNISQNGMYIEADRPLPFHSSIDVHLPFKSKLNVLINFNDNVIEVPVRVKRLVKNDSSFMGMGVELSHESHGYLSFMSNLILLN